MTPSLRYTTIDSAIGDLLLVGDGHALRGLYMQAGPRPMAIAADWRHDPDGFAETRAQLDDYFAGRRTQFELELAFGGTPFQQRVWRALQEIPFGVTVSYGQLATTIGQPSAVRAVGLANGRNPISVIVPCHRVIGADGSLTGYGGGTERKRLLLDLEQASARPRLDGWVGAPAGAPDDAPVGAAT